MTTSEPRTWAPVKVGAIFECSWGYDQTNVDFYEMLEVSPSGQTVKVRQICSRTDDPSWDSPSVKVVPKRQPHPHHPEILTKRLRPPSGTWGASFRVASYATAHQWDGSPRHETGVGWGH